MNRPAFSPRFEELQNPLLFGGFCCSCSRTIGVGSSRAGADVPVEEGSDTNLDLGEMRRLAKGESRLCLLKLRRIQQIRPPFCSCSKTIGVGSRRAGADAPTEEDSGSDLDLGEMRRLANGESRLCLLKLRRME